MLKGIKEINGIFEEILKDELNKFKKADAKTKNELIGVITTIDNLRRANLDISCKVNSFFKEENYHFELPEQKK